MPQSVFTANDLWWLMTTESDTAWSWAYLLRSYYSGCPDFLLDHLHPIPDAESLPVHVELDLLQTLENSLFMDPNYLRATICGCPGIMLDHLNPIPIAIYTSFTNSNKYSVCELRLALICNRRLEIAFLSESSQLVWTLKSQASWSGLGLPVLALSRRSKCHKSRVSLWLLGTGQLVTQLVSVASGNDRQQQNDIVIVNTSFVLI